jgi:hypothetical protein
MANNVSTENQRVHSNTLTRWHKIGERANEKLGDLNAQITELLGIHVLTVDTLDRDLEKSHSDLNKVAKLQAERDSVSDALASIRKALARANVEQGVSDLLVDMETLRRKISGLNVYIGNSRFQDVSQAKEVINQKKDFISNIEKSLATVTNPVPVFDQIRTLKREAVNFFPVSESDVETVKEQITALRKEVVKLGDSLSDKNATKIQIALSESASKSLGL